MEPLDSPLQKPPSTGGLKLMTVFIGVLALHVVVIVGFLVYHLIYGSSGELLADKSKTVKVASESLHGDEPTASTNDTSSTTGPALATSETAATTPTTPPPSNSVLATTQVPAAAPASPVQMPIAPVTPIAPLATSNGDSTNEELAVPADPTSRTYTVRSGDSLAHIARVHRLTLHRLKAANHLVSDELFVGQRLDLPNTAKELSADQNSAPEGTSAVLTETASSAPVASTDADQAALVPTPTHGRMYTVMKGDTLTRLARRFHTTPSKLMALNGITDPRKLSVGQKLRLPSRLQSNNSASNVPAVPTRSSPVSETPEPRLANLNR